MLRDRFLEKAKAVYGFQENADMKKTTELDQSIFIGIGAMANCLLNTNQIDSGQAQYVVSNQLKKDGLEYLMEWGKGPEATKAIVRVSKIMKPDCNPSSLNPEKVGKIILQEMKSWKNK